MNIEVEISDDELKTAMKTVINEAIRKYLTSYRVTEAIEAAVKGAMTSEVQRLVLAAAADSESLRKTIVDELRAKLSRQINAALKAAA